MSTTILLGAPLRFSFTMAIYCYANAKGYSPSVEINGLFGIDENVFLQLGTCRSLDLYHVKVFVF